MTTPPPHASADDPQPQPSGLGPLGDLQVMASMLRADHDELPSYVRLLADTLGDVLPPDMVQVQYDRSFADRMASRPGTPSSLLVHGAEGDFELGMTKRGLRGQARKTVGGVVISRREIDVAEFVSLLAAQLTTLAARDRRANEALSRLYRN
ncbi:MAG: hypothetical protein ABI137_03835 [Antricoccus sp.]